MYNKTEFSLDLVSYREALDILMKYHYLRHESNTFRSGYNVGLFLKDRLVGVCIFSNLPVPTLPKSMYGLTEKDQTGMYELSRLCIVPDLQGKVYNITSWFLSRSIKMLRKNNKVRSILSYADTRFHDGIIYRATNFKYYGKTLPRNERYYLQLDGTYKKHRRGKVNLDSELRPRPVKHRYVLTYDKSLTMVWKEVSWKTNLHDVCRTVT